MPLAKVPALNSYPGHRELRRSRRLGMRGAQGRGGTGGTRGSERPRKGCELGGGFNPYTEEQRGFPKRQAEHGHYSGLSPGLSRSVPGQRCRHSPARGAASGGVRRAAGGHRGPARVWRAARAARGRCRPSAPAAARRAAAVPPCPPGPAGPRAAPPRRSPCGWGSGGRAVTSARAGLRPGPAPPPPARAPASSSRGERSGAGRARGGASAGRAPAVSLRRRKRRGGCSGRRRHRRGAASGRARPAQPRLSLPVSSAAGTRLPALAGLPAAPKRLGPPLSPPPLVAAFRFPVVPPRPERPGALRHLRPPPQVSLGPSALLSPPCLALPGHAVLQPGPWLCPGLHIPPRPSGSLPAGRPGLPLAHPRWWELQWDPGPVLLPLSGPAAPRWRGWGC